MADKPHIEKFQAFLKSDHKLQILLKTKSPLTGNSAPSINLMITNKKLSQDLVNLGLCQNKSKTVKPCTLVPKDLLRHYWRGLVDGDGSITRSSRDGLLLGLCGTEAICEGFLAFCKETIGIGTCLKVVTRKDGLCYLRFSQGPTRLVAEYLYKDAQIFLDRKKVLADEATCLLTTKT